MEHGLQGAQASVAVVHGLSSGPRALERRLNSCGGLASQSGGFSYCRAPALAQTGSVVEVLGLCLFAWAFFSYSEQGLLFVGVHGLLTAAASPVAACEIWSMDSVIVVQKLSRSEAHEILPDQESNLCPCTGRMILKHWTIREVPVLHFIRHCIPSTYL